MVDVYTQCTHDSVKKKIITQFTKESPLRVVIATIAFGMGINCPDVRHVIHWGVPDDAETCAREWKSWQGWKVVMCHNCEICF